MRNSKLPIIILALLTIAMLAIGCTSMEDHHTVQAVESGSRVTWENALEILKSGEVAEVHQSHDLSVTLILKDQRLIYTTEPSIDDIFSEVETCGEPCTNIAIATE